MDLFRGSPVAGLALIHLTTIFKYISTLALNTDLLGDIWRFAEVLPSSIHVFCWVGHALPPVQSCLSWTLVADILSMCVL